jgi:four helix bundle protein
MSKSFRDLIAFQRALDLIEVVYNVTEPFPVRERYGLVAQVRRAGLGVLSHIAEGEGRLSLGEWRQFLSQARGSLFEVEAQMIAANRLRFLSDDNLIKVERAISRVGRALSGLLRYVLDAERRSKQPRPKGTSRPRDSNQRSD